MEKRRVKEEFWSGNALISRLGAAGEPSSEAFVVFRGFPGEIPPGQEAKYAHLAARAGIAQALHEATGRDVYAAAYEGLGPNRRGRFTFEGSVTRGAEIAAELAARRARLHVVGYSWGGLVAYNAARALGAKRGKLILIAPVADISGPEVARGLIAPIVKDYPNLFGPYDAAVGPAVESVAAVGRRFNPVTLAQGDGRAGPALIVHGTRDADVPIEPARRLAARIGAALVELDDDHIFNAGWDRMLAEISAFARA